MWDDLTGQDEAIAVFRAAAAGIAAHVDGATGR